MIGDDFITNTRKVGNLWICRITEEGVSHWSFSKYGAIRGAVAKAQRREYRRNLRRLRRG